MLLEAAHNAGVITNEEYAKTNEENGYGHEGN